MTSPSDDRPNPLQPRATRYARRSLLALGLAAVLVVGGCSASRFGSAGSTLPAEPQGAMTTLPPAAGESIGQGPVRVALLLPLTGDASLASVGTSMANAARLAIAYVEASPTIADNVTIVLKDTGASVGGATRAASEAVNEGASLILGPLKADQVTAAGVVARSAGIPLIGFSNNSGAAAPGIYLLNVLPEVEARRSLGFVKAQGRQAFAAIFPTTDYGRIQEGAFRQAVADLGINARAVYTFSSETEARSAIQQVAPLLIGGQIDALFIPDRATASSLGVLLEEAKVPQGKVQIIGSVDWNNDPAIANTPYLSGAVFPAVDDAGYLALKTEYQAKFGAAPHALSTIAYTAAILSNASSLALGNPRYDRGQLTIAAGFTGRDGVFRFLPDGRSEYALVMKQVTVGGANVVDGARL